MTPLSIVVWFNRAFRNIGLHGCSSHSGRRTFITRAARLVHKAGGSLRDVQLFAGDRSIQTTQRYMMRRGTKRDRDQLTLNQRVQGSSPCAPTNHFNGLAGTEPDSLGPVGRSVGRLCSPFSLSSFLVALSASAGSRCR